MGATTQDLSYIPSFLNSRGNKIIENIASVFAGVGLLSLLAQIALLLPWTPVPITGQTFGVALVALLWGRKRGTLVFFSYLLCGGLGLPVFAMGKVGLLLGPTSGYLIGMLVATYVVGALADRGWTKTFFRTYLAAMAGSAITFAFGLFVLSFYMPSSVLLSAGLLPFLPGDVIKTLCASTIAFQSTKSRSIR